MKRSVNKGDKGEEKVIEVLSTFKDEYYLINNLMLLGDNDVSHQIDHILIRHNGVFVIETKYYHGEITGDATDLMWTKTYFKKGKKVIEKFHNPIKQNNSHIRAIKKVIGKDIPLINFVVFIDNDVSHLGIYKVVNLSQLVERISLWESETTIDSKKMKEINDLLLYSEADLQNKDHLDRIKTIKKQRRDIRHDSILVMEKGICPVCGNKVTMNKNIYICNKCKYTLKI